MLETATTDSASAATAPASPAPAPATAPAPAVPEFRVFRPDNPYVALGLAVNHLMTKPAFANCKFGDWSRILVGQINRKHFWFVVDAKNQIQGFMGWAFCSKDKAEDWVEGRAGLSYDDAKGGDCVVFNAWAANSLKVNRFLLQEGRKVIQGKAMVYFKRHYNDGSTRPARLSVNDFVDQHIERRKKTPGE
jgi:hemolysin-activating ACP:hemolysin acyltransferase